jgi:hypothetical protein
MASAYPGALDSFTNPTSTDNLNTTGVLHDVQHADVNNAIVAIEAELGADPSGSFATVAAAVAALLAPSKVKVTRATNQTIANNTGTPIAFTSEDFDADGWHDNTTNNSRITCPTGKGGTYLIVGALDFTPNATNVRSAWLSKNGTGKLVEVVLNATTNHIAIEVISVLALVSTDYIELNAYQASGGNLDVDATTNFKPSLFALYVGP